MANYFADTLEKLIPNKTVLHNIMRANIFAGNYLVDGKQLKIIKHNIKNSEIPLTHSGVCDDDLEDFADKAIFKYPADFKKNGIYIYNFYYGQSRKLTKKDIPVVIVMCYTAKFSNPYDEDTKINALVTNLRKDLILANEPNSEIAKKSDVPLKIVNMLTDDNEFDTLTVNQIKKLEIFYKKYVKPVLSNQEDELEDKTLKRHGDFDYTDYHDEPFKNLKSIPFSKISIKKGNKCENHLVKEIKSAEEEG